jgi:hypothetical protein
MDTEQLGTPEERASNMGWKPREQWVGDPERWVPADQFIENADRRLDYARKTNKNLERQVTQLQKSNLELKSALDGLRGDMGEFVSFHKDAADRAAKAAYAQALKDAKGKQEAAFESGNRDAFNAATAELDQLIQSHPAVTGQADRKPEVKQPEKREGGTGNPDLDKWLEAEPGALDDWLTKNQWYNEDADMADYAEKVDRLLHRKHRLGIPQSEQLELVTEEVKKKFPSYKDWTNNERKKVATVESSGDSGPVAGKKSYASLPPEAKKQCDKWAGVDGSGKTGTMPGFTREEFVKTYKWE